MKTYNELTEQGFFTDAVTGIFNADCQNIGIAATKNITRDAFENILDEKGKKQAIIDALFLMDETKAKLTLENMFFQSKSIISPLLYKQWIRNKEFMRSLEAFSE